MTIKHHPDDSTLMAYAAGSLPSVLSAVVASHVDMCPHCRRELRLMEQMGFALLDDLTSDARPVSAPVLALRTIACEVSPRAPMMASPSQRATAHSPLSTIPAPVRHLVGETLDGIAWKKVGFGVWRHALPTPTGAEGVLTLLKIEPGRSMPEHGHGGTELTLMLAGAYSDHTGRYERGDIADVDADMEHRPIADAVVGCICLVASERKASFKSVISRIVQPWTGL